MSTEPTPKLAAKKIRVVAIDVATNKSRSMTIFDTTPDYVIDLLRRTIAALPGDEHGPHMEAPADPSTSLFPTA